MCTMCILALYADKLLVVSQSSSVELLKCDEAMPVFYIASNHSLQLDYQWYKGDNEIGVSSPVVYVNREGM